MLQGCLLGRTIDRHAAVVPSCLPVCIPTASKAVMSIHSALAGSNSTSRHAAVLQERLPGSSLGRHAALLLFCLAACAPTVSKTVDISAMAWSRSLDRHATVLQGRLLGSCFGRHAAVLLHCLAANAPTVSKAVIDTASTLGRGRSLDRQNVVLLPRFWVPSLICAIAGGMADWSCVCVRRHAVVLHRL